MEFDQLGTDILELILGLLGQIDLVSIGRTSKLLNKLANKLIYKNITVVDARIASEYIGFVDVKNVQNLVENVQPKTFELIESITIHSQSTIEQYDYSSLYTAVVRSLRSCPRPIQIDNFDLTSIRRTQAINSFCSNQEICMTDNEDEQTVFIEREEVLLKLLKNWIVVNVDDFKCIPASEHLSRLTLFMETMPSQSSSFNISDASCSHISELYLSSPYSTSLFASSISVPRKLRLKKLSVTNSHTFQEGSQLTFKSLNDKLEMSELKGVEFKFCCNNFTCVEKCIVRFFEEWLSSTDISNLNTLSIINYKSNTSHGNLEQYSALIKVLTSFKFENIESFYINICDITSPPLKSVNLFSIFELIELIVRMANLKILRVPDFFSTWISGLQKYYTDETNTYGSGSDSKIMNYVINRCHCHSCNEKRDLFQSLAEYDTSNYFMHNFDDFNWSPNTIHPNTIDLDILQNRRFISFLVNHFKSNSSYCYQNLHTISSTLVAPTFTMEQNTHLESLKSIFVHSFIKDLFNRLLIKDTKLSLIYIGGILCSK